jgi:WXG100 family type VII secretion target
MANESAATTETMQQAISAFQQALETCQQQRAKSEASMETLSKYFSGPQATRYLNVMNQWDADFQTIQTNLQFIITGLSGGKIHFEKSHQENLDLINSLAGQTGNFTPTPK